MCGKSRRLNSEVNQCTENSWNESSQEVGRSNLVLHSFAAVDDVLLSLGRFGSAVAQGPGSSCPWSWFRYGLQVITNC
jgi:hypothetical protein